MSPAFYIFFNLFFYVHIFLLLPIFKSSLEALSVTLFFYVFVFDHWDWVKQSTLENY